MYLSSSGASTGSPFASNHDSTSTMSRADDSLTSQKRHDTVCTVKMMATKSRNRRDRNTGIRNSFSTASISTRTMGRVFSSRVSFTSRKGLNIRNHDKSGGSLARTSS